MDGAMAANVGLGGAARRMPMGGLAGSLTLHLALLAALFLLTPLRSFVAPEPQPIAVDLIPFSAIEPPPEAEQAAPPQLVAPPADTPTTELTATEPVPGAPAQAADGTFRATRLYAATLLQQPDMASVRRGLTTLASSEKVTQLCNIEALEQIRLAAPHYDPDTLVSYAMSQPISSGLMLTALGGAFRSRRLWYGISFECVAAPTLDGVTSFSFRLGEPIPESEWEEHFLNAEDKVE
jgi:hypothetical protein